MADYVIGDVQGCYDALLRLLDCINFNEHNDRLWFVGDLVNRGPQSLAVLRFVSNLPLKPHIALGNHDLHLLKCLFIKGTCHHSDTLSSILQADDGESLGHWLRQQNILIVDDDLNVAVCHAGIAPIWDLSKAQRLAGELESVLHGSDFIEFLHHMYGNEPAGWSEQLTNFVRLRVICNYFTRMRFCNIHGELDFEYKGKLEQAPASLYPWFAFPNRYELSVDVIFGHWASLEGQCQHPHIYALDTGCLWGGRLTALRLQDRMRFSVPGLSTVPGR